MAARRNKLTLGDEWRARIQTSMLINRLEDHILNKIRLEATQIKAIEILLRKVAPDLSHVDANVNVQETPQARVFPMGITEDEQHRLPTASETVDSIH